MPEKKIQEYLFQRIKELLPSGQSLVDTIADSLCVSQDSAYRRIRGETLLVLEEARLLCHQFNLSLDQVLQLKDDSVVFQSSSLDQRSYDFAGFLRGILHEIKQLEASSEKNIIYVCKDIPLFHQLCAKEVLAFRYFIWMRNVFEHPDFLREKFSMRYLTPAIEALSRELYTAYSKIPSIEIWSLESINGILMQLQYYVQSGVMTKEDSWEVSAGLYRELEHLHLQAAYGCKFLPGEVPQSKKENFQLFFNRMGVPNNTILTSFDGKQKLYLNYDALSYITTTDEAFCNKVQQQLQMEMRRSTLISQVSEKQRTMFFNLLYAKLPRTELKHAKLAS